MDARTAAAARTVADRPLLAAYTSYADAQKAVDTLSDKGFPVQNLAIVGVDLRTVESVLGRMSWGRAAAGGLLTGAWFGLLIGLFVSLFATAEVDTLQLVLLGLVYGGGFGIVFGLVSYALTRGRRDFTSRSALTANSYEVRCEAAVIAQARSMLGISWPPPVPAAQAPAAQAPATQAPATQAPATQPPAARAADDAERPGD
jgi:hypothetical protein